MSFYFQYRGRRWRVAQRSDSTNWYLAFEYRGRRYNESLHSNSRKTAVAAAKLKIDVVCEAPLQEVRALLDRTRRRTASPVCATTAAQIVQAHGRAGLDLAEHTARDYRSGLLRFLALSGGSAADPLSALTPGRLEDYAVAVTKSARESGDDLSAARIRRSGAQVLAKVRAMFAVDAVRAYRLAGLEVPGLTVFFDALKSTRAKLRRGAKAGEQPADDAVVQRLLAQWPSLPRNEFLAVGLGLACGLRPGEVAKATWDWLTVRNGVPWLFFEASDASGFKVKNRSGVISVRPLDPFWRILNERADREGWRGGAGVFLLDGSPSERKDYVSRRISVWLRSLGWRARFIQHALRAWSGGQVCLKWNLETARTWLRHENIKTTDEHYMYLLNEAERYGLSRTAAVEWAA